MQPAARHRPYARDVPKLLRPLFFRQAARQAPRPGRQILRSTTRRWWMLAARCLARGRRTGWPTTWRTTSSCQERGGRSSGPDVSATDACCNLLVRSGHAVTRLPAESCGIVSVEKVADAITSKTALVTVIHAQNEIGTLQPVREIVHGRGSEIVAGPRALPLPPPPSRRGNDRGNCLLARGARSPEQTP